MVKIAVRLFCSTKKVYQIKHDPSFDTRFYPNQQPLYIEYQSYTVAYRTFALAARST